jgi:hypothetical protein
LIEESGSLSGLLPLNGLKQLFDLLPALHEIDGMKVARL